MLSLPLLSVFPWNTKVLFPACGPTVSSTSFCCTSRFSVWSGTLHGNSLSLLLFLRQPANSTPATGAHICLLPTTLSRSCRNITSPITGRGKNSPYLFIICLCIGMLNMAVFLGSRRRSRKFVPLSACEGIAVSHSARPRTQGNRIKPSSSERTIHQKLALVRPDIRCIATMQDIVFILHADYLIFVVICKPPDNSPTTHGITCTSVQEAAAYL